MSRTNWLYAAGLLWVVIIFATSVWLTHHECQKLGGTLVRGVFWFECVDIQKQQEIEE